jgi:hypothetical protein
MNSEKKKMFDTRRRQKIEHSGQFKPGEYNPNFGKTISDEI